MADNHLGNAESLKITDYTPAPPLPSFFQVATLAEFLTIEGIEYSPQGLRNIFDAIIKSNFEERSLPESLSLVYALRGDGFKLRTCVGRYLDWRESAGNYIGQVLKLVLPETDDEEAPSDDDGNGELRQLIDAYRKKEKWLLKAIADYKDDGETTVPLADYIHSAAEEQGKWIY